MNIRRQQMSNMPILVTGSHRSGTTWVGKMIAKSASIGYIYEPFHLNYRPGICGARFKYWFTYITEENEAAFYESIKQTLNFSYNLAGAFRSLKQLKDALRIVRDGSQFVKYRYSRARPLMKDPVALASSEWLAQRFGMNVIVMIRHPAAFTSSLKRLNWSHPFSHFLEQPLLMRDHLYPFEDQIRDFADKEYDIVDQSILLWKITHSLVRKFQMKHEDWYFIRHEDLSHDPLSGFRAIFEWLGLDYTERIQKMIREFSDQQNPSILPSNQNSIKRHSKAVVNNWKHMLSNSEVLRVRKGVEEFSHVFYSDEDWSDA
ncbi:sulfotransferase [Acidobacteriota bacterium]